MLPKEATALLLLFLEAAFVLGWLVLSRHWERKFVTDLRRRELQASKGKMAPPTKVSRAWGILSPALFFGVPALFVIDGLSVDLGVLYAPSLSFFNPWDTFLQAAGLLLALLGLVVALLAGRLLAEHVYGRAAGERRLITSGVYAHVRHPFYLSGVLLASGMLLLALNYLALLLLPPVLFFTNSDLEECGRRGKLTFLTKAVECEEETLRRRFGQQYDAYASGTGRFVPRLLLRR